MFRKQYHSREVKGDQHIWDVHELVRLSANLPIDDIPLEDIQELDETWWYPPNSAPPTSRSIADHAKLIAETDLAYPIILCPEGRLMDGMHRVCKAYMQGHQTIKARRFPTMPRPDYVNKDLDELPY